jgi:uncharacterized RmlC-like cupin family protein
MSGVTLVRPSNRDCTTAQTTGMVREAGVSPATTGAKTIWSGYVMTPAGTASGVHHHGDCESAIYMLKGRMRFSWGEKLEHSAEASAGDFIFVPPNEIHMEENLSETDPVEFIVSRGCTEMLVVNVPDPREGSGQ